MSRPVFAVFVTSPEEDIDATSEETTGPQCVGLRCAVGLVLAGEVGKCDACHSVLHYASP